MKVSDAIIRHLVGNDVDTVFSLMADDIMGISATIKADWQSDIQVVENRHEQLAVAMASGYAEAGRRIGVCCVGRGPAIAQTGTALVTARKQNTPLLVVCADSPTSSIHDVKDFNQEAFLDMTIGSVITVQDESAVLSAFDDAFHHLAHDEGPIAVQISKDVIDRDISVPNGTWEAVAAPREPTEIPRIEPSDDQIDRVVDAYLESGATAPPVVLVGRGAVRSEAKAAIEALVERTSAVVLTTLRAQGYFLEHDFAAGFVGTAGSNLANEQLHDADFVLAFGASLNRHTTDQGRLFGDEATVVHVDSDPSSIERETPVDVGVVGDARLAARKIDDRLADMDIDFSGRFRSTNLERRIAESGVGDEEFPVDQDRLDPRDLLEALDSRLPRDRNVVIDAGQFSYWVFDGITVTDPDGLVWPIGFASIGLGLPSGIGAAFAADADRTTVTFCGDAGFMMSLQELDTAVRNDVPVIIIVMNDDALGAEYAQLKLKGWNEEAGLVPTPDLAAIAEGFGAESYTVSSTEEVAAIEDVLSRRPDGPVLVDCKITPEVIHRRFHSI